MLEKIALSISIIIDLIQTQQIRILYYCMTLYRLKWQNILILPSP